MNIFYEESGQLKTASIITRNDASYQVTTQHGKRAKVKANNVFFEFSQNQESFHAEANALANEIDISLLWECCGEEEVSAKILAKEYFGHEPKETELASILMALYASPVYFYKRGKGYFKSAPEQTLKQALASIERKKAEEVQIKQWVTELNEGKIPDIIQQDIISILHDPNKQSLSYKAFAQASTQAKLSHLDFARQLGLVKSTAQYLHNHFTLKYFPQGISLPEIPIPDYPKLPQADVTAFSIDSSDTTEIDDAISVKKLDNGQHQIGIHIASPSIAIQEGSLIEKIIQDRQSTVYFPTGKITMLPSNWIKHFSLDEGGYHPCVSVYFQVASTGEVSFLSTCCEQVFIADNLRLEDTDELFNPNTTPTIGNPALKYQDTLNWLFTQAQQLQTKRGEQNNNIINDYKILVDDNGIVQIQIRQRGSPIDIIVSELMILANSTWAKILDDNQIIGIFRNQTAGNRVSIQLYAREHIGMGVSHYAWLTSPLRRAIDTINQQQLLSFINHTIPRYPEKSTDLYVALQDFDTRYNAYKAFQQRQESYWSLVYIQQQSINELQATFIRDDLVRINGLPLVVRACGIPIDLIPRTPIHLRIQKLDPELEYIELQYIGVAG